MAFINSIQSIIRKSNGDILNFYINNKEVYYRRFLVQKGWKNPTTLIKGVIHNQIDIKIDPHDRVYGIANNESGKLIYIYTSEEEILHKELFSYDDKYTIKYPFILKTNRNIHIIYYIQDIENKHIWGLIHHFYDGKSWHQNSISIVKAFPVINPFSIVFNNKELGIYYLSIVNNWEEIFYSEFDLKVKSWKEPTQITNTCCKKLYLNALIDNINNHHITWSEFINENLVVRYLSNPFYSDNPISSKIISLSNPSNCSFPTIIKTNNILWNIWVEMDKLISTFSLNNGETWKKPRNWWEDEEMDFIRYRFSSNYPSDIKSFTLNNIFGTFYPKITFIGFKNVKS